MILRMLIFNLIFLLIFNVLSDFYFYKYAVCRLTQSKIFRVGHWVLDGLFVVSMAVLFLFVNSEGGIPHSVYQSYMYAYFLIYIPKLVYMVLSFPIIFSRGKVLRRTFTTLGGVVAGAIFLSVLWGGTVGRNTVRVTEITISSKDIPAAFDGYRIAHISDAHVGNMTGDRLLQKTLRRINEMQPDMIIFSGDMVHSRTSEIYPFEKVLSEFNAPDGIFTVMGNHDYGDYTKWNTEAEHKQNVVDLHDFYDKTGWVLLSNTNRIIHRATDSIALIGVENWGEPPFPQYGKLANAMVGTDSVAYKMLVTHNPEHWTYEVVGKTNIGLSFSGHTHAMQSSISLFGKRYSPAALKYKLWGGLYSEGDQHIIVNEGLGVVLLPMRIGATPEISLITLRRDGI